MQFFKLWAMDSFGNINVPSSQAVLWLRTAIAVFIKDTQLSVFFYIWY